MPAFVAAFALTFGLVPTAGAASAGEAVRIEALTSPELAARIAAGTTTVLVPIGGTEQNGPHMVLGKHNVRALSLAEAIARDLGHAVVAPVVAYVPEGRIEPPVAHMRFAGTISVPEPVFEALLESAARSLRHAGLRQVVLLGDHGGYQASLERVAARLNREWAADPPSSRARAWALSEYYRASTEAYARSLAGRGFGAAEIGSHAGLADTSLALAIDPALVRTDQLSRAAAGGTREGVSGDPRRASAELGRAGVDAIVAASVAAIRQRSAAP